MKMNKFALLPICLAIMMFVSGFQSGSIVQVDVPENELAAMIHDIQKGGYILYMRHGEATVGQDRPVVDFDDCSTQRNLSDAGREQAKLLGMSMRKLNIPVQYPVVASPYCRTRETAELAFGSGNVVVDPSLADVTKLSDSSISAAEKQSIVTQVEKMLEVKPSSGTNKVIIGHAFPAGVAVGEIPYMGTVVIKPKGPGNGYEVVQKFSLQDFMR
ncbi:histidine phosphatase family protein [Paenibacillus alvei]|uniref:Phosphoglycerate mutase n=1 Tax=Paenibacillus alvei TaxID=44250 RepID=A0A383RBK7_PAEAL|nr:histidine phosphatase family protein [Paenibacillus alvei]SYX84338.1 Phosphoglycerate mutase [Paenibacillus alvei]